LAVKFDLNGALSLTRLFLQLLQNALELYSPTLTTARLKLSRTLI